MPARLVPLVAITGQVAQSLIGTDAFQEVDTYGLTLPVTKHNFLVRHPAELLDIVPLAFQLAESGRPGPVAIDVPKDVQNATIDVVDCRTGSPGAGAAVFPMSSSRPSPAASPPRGVPCSTSAAA